MYDDDLPETHGKWMGIAIGWWILIVGLILGTAMLFANCDAWFVEKQTHVTRESNAYITSKQTALRSLKNSYDMLEERIVEIGDVPANKEIVGSFRTQQRGIVMQMRELADLIPKDVQPDIREFLDKR